MDLCSTSGDLVKFEKVQEEFVGIFEDEDREIAAKHVLLLT